MIARRFRIPGFQCSRTGRKSPEGDRLWVRVFGFGVYARDVRGSLWTQMSFSEKAGLVNFVLLGGWLIRFRYPFDRHP